MVRKPETKKCPIESCSTSKKKIRSQRLSSLPLTNITNNIKQKVTDKFKIRGNEKACRKCRTEIMAFIRNSKDKEPSETRLPSKVGTTSLNNTSVSHGRPRVNYTDASRGTKKRMKATAKTLFKNVVDQCNKISKGDGWKLLQDVTVKTPIQPNTIQEVCPKFSQVMDGKIRVFSTPF